MDTVGGRIKRARQDKGWSQTKLAQMAGVSQGTIGNIEAGIRGGAESLAKIAAALGVRYEWLDTGDGPQAAQAAWPLSAELLSAIQAAPPSLRRQIENAARAMLDLDPLPRESGGAGDSEISRNAPSAKVA